jgi:HK97 gp10 family phage protein
LRVQVISGAPYAAALERGTSRMAARPYMGPATRNRKKEVVATVQRAIEIATRKRK